jgi:hypothetical protein
LISEDIAVKTSSPDGKHVIQLFSRHSWSMDWSEAWSSYFCNLGLSPTPCSAVGEWLWLVSSEWPVINYCYITYSRLFLHLLQLIMQMMWHKKE